MRPLRAEDVGQPRSASHRCQRLFKERPGKSTSANDAAERAAVELAMQRNRKRTALIRDLPIAHRFPSGNAVYPPASQHGVFEAVFAQEIAQLRARKDAQLRHASIQAL